MKNELLVRLDVPISIMNGFGEALLSRIESDREVYYSGTDIDRYGCIIVYNIINDIDTTLRYGSFQQ